MLPMALGAMPPFPQTHPHSSARLFVETFSSIFTPALFAILRSESRADVKEGQQKLVSALATLDK